MTDPLHDPRFPDRPQHPDFWRLSQVVLRHDGAAQEEGQAGFDRIMAESCDMDSLYYICKVRAEMIAQNLGLDQRLVPALTSSYLAGVIHGIGFQKAGGRQD